MFLESLCGYKNKVKKYKNYLNNLEFKIGPKKKEKKQNFVSLFYSLQL